MSEDKKDTAASPEGKAPEAKPEDFVLLQHLQRCAESRTQRASRSGHRRQGVLLDDGTRIRRRGYRMTQMSISTLVANHQAMLEHVREGRLAIFDSSGEKELSYDQLLELLQKNMKGGEIKQASLKDSVQELVATPELGTSRPEDTTRPDMDAAAMVAAVDQAEAKKSGHANSPPSERAEEPVSPKRSGKRSKS